MLDNLSGCQNLETLPESICQLQSLQELNLGWCENLKIPPESICHLQNLQTLYLNGCENLETLPESIGQLSNLRELNLNGCENLTTRIQLTSANLRKNIDITRFCRSLQMFDLTKNLRIGRV